MRLLCIVKTLSIQSVADHFQSQWKESLPTLDNVSNNLNEKCMTSPYTI